MELERSGSHAAEGATKDKGSPPLPLPTDPINALISLLSQQLLPFLPLSTFQIHSACLPLSSLLLSPGKSCDKSLKQEKQDLES